MAMAKTQTVREFSTIGPCITLGEFVRETNVFYVYRTGRHGISGPDAETIEKRIAKRTEARYSAAHVEPCRSCEDHAQTSYPNGYMD